MPIIQVEGGEYVYAIERTDEVVAKLEDMYTKVYGKARKSYSVNCCVDQDCSGTDVIVSVGLYNEARDRDGGFHVSLDQLFEDYVTEVLCEV